VSINGAEKSGVILPLSGLVVIAWGAVLLSGTTPAQASAFSPAFTVSLSDSTPGANATITTSLTLNSPDAMYGTLLVFIPPEFSVASGSTLLDGSVVGSLFRREVLGLIGGACNQYVELNWDLLDGSTNTADTVSFEDADNNGQFDYAEDVDGDNLYDGVTKYPASLARAFPTLSPRARLVAISALAGLPYMVNVLVFDPGTSVFGSPPDPALGYPTVLTLRDGGDPQRVPAPGAVTDMCSPLYMQAQVFGTTLDNADTSPDEAGQVYRANPGSSGAYPFFTKAVSQPDADADGIENDLDTCQLIANVGHPRAHNSGDLDSDGLDAACDPNDEMSTGTDPDQDGDGYLNRQDNCALVVNGQQETNQLDSDGDNIGDDCDPQPGTLTGHRHTICAGPVAVVGTGGPLPPFASALCDTDSDGFADPSDNCPSVENADGQAADGDGDVAGDACDGPGSGNVDCSAAPNGVTAVDALKVLRHNAALSVSQSEPCLDIGLARLLAPPDDWKMGDVDCSGGVNSIDALKVLRANAGLSVAYVGAGCPEVKPP
jgi:hypothetical protein